jgi:Alpha/beta hydrolase
MKILGTLALSAAVLACTATGAWWTGADPHTTITGLPGASSWSAAVAATVPANTATRRAGGFAPVSFRSGPLDPGSASPAQVAHFFDGLTPAQRTALAHAAPGVVGNLDGAPYDLRYAANAQALGGSEPRPAGHLLGYDPRGDGRAIEVFGDLAAARHVAIVVPGTGWNLHRLLTEEHTRSDTPVATADALYEEMRRLDPVTPSAVVVWLGYDPPENIDREVMRSGRAVDGARALTRFVEGLPPATHVTTVCHSYGAVVCAYAIRDGARIADLAAAAAPGMDVGAARDLRPARVWATRVADDPIRFTPFVRVAGLGHGKDPTQAGFGARVFRTGSAHGHGGYFVPGTESLTNLARIALGRPDEVTLR